MIGPGHTPMSPEENVEAAARDLEASTLRELADSFGQLVYLSSLRDFSTNEYSHWGLENVYGTDAAQKALSGTHRLVFRRVATLPLRELEGQVNRFLGEKADRGEVLLQNWLRDASYNLLVPAEAAPLEVENFRINFETVLAVITHRRRA